MLIVIAGKLSKLAVHPVASFVVARAIGRLTDPQLTAAIKELEGTWPKFISMPLPPTNASCVLMLVSLKT